MKPRVIKVPKEKTDSLQDTLKENLGLENFQLYFPALSHWFNYYNNDSFQKFTLNSEYLLESLSDNLEDEFKDTYIKHMFKAIVFNQNTLEKSEREVFIKMNPILDVINYIKNDYNLEISETPNIFNFTTNNKINSYHNSAYIDNFFTYIGSKYNELNLCPTFPEYYGGFIGVTDKYEYDLSEEYEMIKDMNWFKQNLDRMFKIRVKELEIPLDEKIVFSGNKSENGSGSESESGSGEEEEEAESESENELELEIEDDDAADYVEPLEDFIDESEWVTESEGEDNSENDSVSSFEIDSTINQIHYCKFKRFPVQLVAMEKMEYTLENLVEDLEYEISEEEWLGIFFQICFGLSVAFKRNKFVHNDLHCSNIMFVKTEREYLYFKFKSKVFRIPTFGRITKIIDFGRATFTVDNKIFFSDVFRKNGDAEGQYSFPYNNSMKNCKVKPNPSFDLCRLTKTIIDYFEEGSDLYKLLELWCSDKYGNSLLEHDDDFDLYRVIAKNVRSAVPVKQLDKKVFKRFIIDESELPEDEILYKF